MLKCHGLCFLGRFPSNRSRKSSVGGGFTYSGIQPHLIVLLLQILAIFLLLILSNSLRSFHVNRCQTVPLCVEMLSDSWTQITHWILYHKRSTLVRQVWGWFKFLTNGWCFWTHQKLEMIYHSLFQNVSNHFLLK